MEKASFPLALLAIWFLIGFVPCASGQTAGKLQTIRVAFSERPKTLDLVNHRDRIAQTLHRIY